MARANWKHLEKNTTCVNSLHFEITRCTYPSYTPSCNLIFYKRHIITNTYINVVTKQIRHVRSSTRMMEHTAVTVAKYAGSLYSHGYAISSHCTNMRYNSWEQKSPWNVNLVCRKVGR